MSRRNFLPRSTLEERQKGLRTFCEKVAESRRVGSGESLEGVHVTGPERIVLVSTHGLCTFKPTPESYPPDCSILVRLTPEAEERGLIDGIVRDKYDVLAEV